MKQILQNIRNGKLSVADIPAPLAQRGQVLIANTYSLISAGTEKMTMDLAKKSLLAKAKERPDQVRRVIEKMKNEGFFETLKQVQTRLDEPIKLGYSSSGIILACGAGVQVFKPGDRVASNGPHAGVVSVPEHLVALLPDNVSFEQAAFTVVSSIALQGVRLTETHLGETVFVVGLGLVGQLAVQILDAAGIRVIGTDPDESKCRLALQMGAEVARPDLPASEVESLTRGLGADAVLLTAATSSNGPIELAANAVRQKGRIVLVGVVGLNLDRRPFYFKEAEFVVSCSYGPGRYDSSYEEGGRDYPASYVRWTEHRNFQAVLDMMGSGKLDSLPLITHRFPIEEAEKAYAIIGKGAEPYLGMLLQYPETEPGKIERTIRLATSKPEGKIGIGVIGAGNFAKATLLPALAKEPALRPALICSSGGISALQVGGKQGFEAITTDEEEVLKSRAIQALFILTRHDQHARQVIRAIEEGKHVFVEKPLGLTLEEIQSVENALAAKGDKAPLLLVGFNRRFSPLTQKAKAFFHSVVGPKTISIRFNAGAIPAEHWTQDEKVGGGRLIGEACHAIDLATYLIGAPPVKVYAESIGGANAPDVTDDQCFITLRHADGSVSSIGYLAGGDKAFPKERVEIFGGGKVAVIDDFKELLLSGLGHKSHFKLSKQDKGHSAEIEAFVKALTHGGESPISWSDLKAVSLASILAVQSLREGVPFEIS